MFHSNHEHLNYHLRQLDHFTYLLHLCFFLYLLAVYANFLLPLLIRFSLLLLLIVRYRSLDYSPHMINSNSVYL